jgi:hypothetical protein
MHARVVTFQGSPEKMQDPEAGFRERVLPVLQQQPGLKSVMILLDRKRGKLLGITLWESEQTADAATTAMQPIGNRSAAEFGASEPTREAFEVIYSG